MKKTYTTTLRLNLENDDDRRAYEYLQRLDKAQYRSVNRAVVAAVNTFFGRQEQLTADPYLETRKKEDDFLGRIEEIIVRSLQNCAPVNLGGLLQLVQGAQSAAAPAPEDTDEDMEAALDFADSF